MSFLKNDLSFFDCNAFIGRHQNPYIDSSFEIKNLEAVNKTSGIKKSLIYHSASVLYDASFGNELIINEIKGKDNFYPIWIALPELCNGKKHSEDFFSSIRKNQPGIEARFRERNKIFAVKIFPRYHGYNLINGALDNLFSFLEKEKIPLLVNQEEILWDEINYVLENFKNFPLILQNAGYRMERYLFSFFSKYKNFFMDISRYQSHGGIEFLCSQFGSEKIIFGSGLPIFSPEPIMMMIDNAKISLEEKQNISSKNLLRLLNLD